MRQAAVKATNLSLDRIRLQHEICQSRQFVRVFRESLWRESHRQSAGIQPQVSLRHDRRSVPDEGTYSFPRSDPSSNRT
jgi:hypothetical protein